MLHTLEQTDISAFSAVMHLYLLKNELEFEGIEMGNLLLEAVDFICRSLGNMNKEMWILSKILYGSKRELRHLNEGILKELKESKYFERPFAYEFYHQLRILMDQGMTPFENCVVQGEVNKGYQSIFVRQENKTKKFRNTIPDFLIHVPNKQIIGNWAIIEFKRANNLNNLTADLDKLLAFREHPKTLYKIGVEVIIGTTDEFELCDHSFRRKRVQYNGGNLWIIEYNLQTQKIDKYMICHKMSKKVRREFGLD
jgi:hypothetical protein